MIEIPSKTATAEAPAALTRPPLPRHAFDLAPGVLWVMHCAEGPVPRAAAAAVTRFLVREKRPWELGWEEDFLGLPRRVKGQAAHLFGTRPEDLSLVSTTTGGLTRVAQGFPWRPGDEVVVPLGEFPANAWPWKALSRRGVRFREVPLWDGHRAGAAAWESAPPAAGVAPESRLLESLSPSTRLLSVSWVRFQDGLALDLARLAAGCRERGVTLVVDGIQGAGTRPVELAALSGVDAFACGGHKGLLAPQGLGLLYTTPALRRLLAPPGGWLSVEQATDFDRPSTDLERGFEDDGSRLEEGVPNLVGCAALERSLALLNRAGAAAIAAHVADLQRRLLHRLVDAPAWRSEAARLLALLDERRVGSILALHHGDRGPTGLARLLGEAKREGIYASVREGYFRLALHGWHTQQDADRLAGWLAQATPEGG